MNTMTTLFGGLAAVLVLYAAGGAFRSLPPVLRAALAGLIPLIAYFVLIIGRWPGLDVVSIHISVFLAAALVLHVFAQFRLRGGGRMHWVPKLLTAFFIGLVFLNGALLYVSTKGLPEPVARWWLGGEGGTVYSGFSGVVAHGQNAAKAVSSELSETHRESKLGWQVDLNGLYREARERPLEVRVRDRTGLAVDGVDAVIELKRPGAAAVAARLALDAVEPGVHAGVLRLPAAGRWLVELRVTQSGVEQYHSIHEVMAP